MVSDLGFENWFAANEAIEIWKKALEREPKNSAALFNLGHMFNYYRLYPVALPYLLKVSKKVKIAEVYDQLSVSYWGMVKKTESELNSQKAEELGMSPLRFTKKFREAAAASGAECMTLLNSIPGVAELRGFEKISVSRMRQRCQK
jgi:tetratricopeptide (TPR) repeat protein